jgi:16S rRNA (cytidine1402-2'-O)-methyltransferase
VLADLAAERRTMVFFEAPHRIAEALGAMANAFGPDRAGAVCRELTKTYEEVRRGGLAELAEWAGQGIKGEITVVVAGAPAGRAVSLEDATGEVRALVASGTRLKDACAEVAAATSLRKKDLYEAALAAASP